MNNKPKIVIISVIVAALALAGAFVAYPALTASASTNGPNTSTSTSGTKPFYAMRNGSMSPGLQGKGGPGGWGPGGGFSGRGPPGAFGGPGSRQPAVNFTDGQSFTVTSTQGFYSLMSNHAENGSVTGSLTFTVTAKFAGGYSLSLSSGSLTFNGNTYTISSGSAQMNQFGQSLSGQGMASSSGKFLVQAQAHGSFAGSTASVFFDFESGSAEYVVSIMGNLTS